MLTTLPLALASLATSAHAFKTFSSPALEKPYKQDSSDQYSPLKYLGGNGPYVSRQGSRISPEVPAGCEVDQVVLIQRHGERYPSPSSVRAQRSVLDKIHKQHPGTFFGDLRFLNDWTYFLKSDGDAGLLIESGPYAGTADLFDKGARFRSRYGHLWDGQSKVPLFASESQRVVDSARKFGEGFFGYNYTDIAEITVTPENEQAGLNAVSPYYCATEFVTECEVPSRTSYNGTDSVVFPELDKAAVRLNEQNDLHLTAGDVLQLFKIAAFDVAARGDSPWLNVFTADEWAAFNYQEGMWLHCYFGEGSAGARAIGASFANATAALLKQGPEDSGLPLVLNFGHDSEINNFLAGSGILTPIKPLDPRRLVFGSGWDISDVAPMGAQLVVERLKCSAPGLTNKTNLISANASLPESFLNETYGIFFGSGDDAGYFDPEYQNKTTTTTLRSFWNSTANSTFVNSTHIGQYFNNTIVVKNGTIPGSVVITNSTSRYGFDLDEGTTNGKDTTDSYFVRVVLNDAVVPIDNCYDGPGYACALENYTTLIEESVAKNNYSEVCQPQQSGVPAEVTFFWDRNHTTVADEPLFVPWQGNYVE